MTICSQETEGQQISEKKYLERLKNEDFGSTKIGKLRKYCWNLTEYPETSLAARVGWNTTSSGNPVVDSEFLDLISQLKYF